MRRRTTADHLGADNQIKPSRRRAGRARRVRHDRTLLMGCEQLEERTLLDASVDLLGATPWISQGPQRTTGSGNVEGMEAQGNLVAGAIQVIAVDPTPGSSD